jgi:hypothetical protein
VNKNSVGRFKGKRAMKVRMVKLESNAEPMEEMGYEYKVLAGKCEKKMIM